MAFWDVFKRKPKIEPQQPLLYPINLSVMGIQPNGGFLDEQYLDSLFKNLRGYKDIQKFNEDLNSWADIIFERSKIKRHVEWDHITQCPAVYHFNPDGISMFQHRGKDFTVWPEDVQKQLVHYTRSDVYFIWFVLAVSERASKEVIGGDIAFPDLNYFRNTATHLGSPDDTSVRDMNLQELLLPMEEDEKKEIFARYPDQDSIITAQVNEVLKHRSSIS